MSEIRGSSVKVLEAYRDIKCCGNCQAYRYTPYGVSICQRRDKNANITDPGRCCGLWAADGLTAAQRMKDGR